MQNYPACKELRGLEVLARGGNFLSAVCFPAHQIHSRSRTARFIEHWFCSIQICIHIHIKYFHFLGHLNNVHRELLYYLALALGSALASTNVKVFVKVFKTSLFPNLMISLIHLWYAYTYWSKIMPSTISTTLGHVKIKVTDLEFSCETFTLKFLGPHYLFYLIDKHKFRWAILYANRSYLPVSKVF